MKLLSRGEIAEGLVIADVMDAGTVVRVRLKQRRFIRGERAVGTAFLLLGFENIEKLSADLRFVSFDDLEKQLPRHRGQQWEREMCA
jgi:hypothetical protein